MPLKISLTRGPLSDEGLDGIVATYGTADGRYASREFCRTVFNENPFGYSFHAFVRDGDQVVGHYAMIPMRTRSRGTTVTSGKGEALFLAESHRSTATETAGGEIPTGIALMKTVHERALAEGLKVVHSITSPEIGVIARMTGLKAVTIGLEQLQFLITPPRHSSYRALGARIWSVAQRVLLTTVRAALRLTAAPATEVNSPAHSDRHLAALAATGPGEAATWSISRDLETLRWLRRLGRLEIVSVEGRPEHFAVLSTGHSRELLLWNVPAGAIRIGLTIACAMLVRSIQEGAQTVWIPRRLAAAGGRSLRIALRMLAFLPRRIPVVIYAKSADPFYLESENVDFSRIFNL